jgi:N-methylhydantoinase A/oxoprolinase/acetone carboxylase beta subunit
MGQEIYRLAVYRLGRDPRTLSMFALGGAGPVHAASLAESADIRRIATFPMSGVFGAFSTLTLDIFQSYERTLVVNLYSGEEGYLVDGLEPVNRAVAELIELGRQDMEEEGYTSSDIEFRAEMQVCYRNQRQTLSIPLPRLGLFDDTDVKVVCEAFNQAYGEHFGQGAVFAEVGIEALGVRVLASVAKQKPRLAEQRPTAAPQVEASGSRAVCWEPDVGPVATPVYRRDDLTAGVRLTGPALVDAKDTVIVVPTGWTMTVDGWDIGWLEKEVAP